jgi:multidrug efflux pump
MVIIGLIGFMNLPVRWIPNVSQPQITIQTSFPGANASMVEHDVTKIIEDSLSSISGMDMLTSKSKQGQSEISISFALGRNMDAAVEDVRSSLERVRGSLPKEIESPIVMKADPNSDAIMYLSIYDAHRNERELSDYIDQYIVPSFETIDGVGSVVIYGKRASAIRIWLDSAKMTAANVTAAEVTQLLKDNSVSVPSGQIRGVDRFYSVIANTTLKTPEQFNDLIIRDKENKIVRLKDIGEAKLGVEDADSIFRISGKPGIALGVIPQSTANPLEVAQQVQKVLTEIKRTLPTGMQANIIYNQADYIRASIHSVYESFLEAVIFVWLVILIFLGRFRATLIPIITIPVCVISTFAILYFLGFSINTITLMAFVLAIGLVVDDAIVMLENISRHMEEGLSAFSAALKGSREIVFPIIAMTLTLAAVYTPIAFTPGLLGVIFREFTFTLAGAVMISGIVALTLSPMMCARILKPVAHSHSYYQWLSHQLEQLQQRYSDLLRWLLLKRTWITLGLLGVAIIGFGIYKFLPSELAPTEDMDTIMVSVAAPRSASYHYTDQYVHQLEAMYDRIPEIKSYLTMSGSTASHAFQYLLLKPKNQRQRSTMEIVGLLNQQTGNLTGVRVYVFTPPPPLAQVAGNNEGDNIGLVLMTSGDYRQLQQASTNMVEALKPLPIFIRVDNKLKWDSEQFELSIDRNRAADLKVSLPAITDTLFTLLAGKTIAKVDESNIIVQINDEARADPNIFQQLYVRNAAGTMVSLSNFVNVQETTTPEFFQHYSRLRSDTINVMLAPKFNVADAVNVLRTVAKENLPDNIKYAFAGEAKSFLDSNGKSALTFLLALVFIYLVLVAQFESFIDPFIILFTVPFAMVGAMLSLKLFGGSLNVYSNIGLITLVGLITKHGILITDFANRLRLQGKSIHEAVVESAMLRLRPILMTTAAMVLGALPLAFAMGPGAENRQQIGLVITGGLLLGTVFSLIVIPIVYTYFAPFKKIVQTSD